MNDPLGQARSRLSADRSNLIHREVIQVIVLIVIAIAAFFVTRAIAANNREMTLRDAAEWYQRGQQQLAAGEAEVAIESFRRAAVKNRTDKRYVLALAGALAKARQYDAARSAMLALRESSPEDPEINLQLARLAAERLDVSETIRYYHNTLYAPWAVDQSDERRRVRMELIRFLLTHDQPSRAISELVAVSTELPDAAASQVEVGRLFATAGDEGRALDHFQRALRLEPENATALAGAGEAAFQLGDYATARRYLRAAPDRIDAVRDRRQIVDLVLSNDPLAARIGAMARRNRLAGNVAYAEKRLKDCIDRDSGAPPSALEVALRDEVQAFKTQFEANSLDEDTIEAGLELIDRIERTAVETCPPATPYDRALKLIGRRHGAGER